MTTTTLSAPLVPQTFPVGTSDEPLVFTITGTLADGASFTLSQPSGSFDLAPGTYTGTVSKTVAGSVISSQPSAPLVVTAPVTLQVPDATQPATLTAA